MFNGYFKSLRDEFKASYLKNGLSRYYVITGDELQWMLENTSNEFKANVVRAAFPKLNYVNGDELVAILGQTSNEYKRDIILECQSKLQNVTSNNVVTILAQTSNPHKGDIIRALEDKCPNFTDNDLCTIINATSAPFKDDVLWAIRRRQPNKIVLRDSNGNFASGSIANNLTGTATANTITDCDFRGTNTLCAIQDIVSKMAEVAIAVSQPQTAQQTPNTQTKKECAICMENFPNAVFVPCGHKVCCFDCGSQLQSCPICRGPKDNFIRVFE